jgi:SPP1 gp7 family putative phage head morphogenesis protein
MHASLWDFARRISQASLAMPGSEFAETAAGDDMGALLLNAFNLPPEQAIEALKAKGYSINWSWKDMIGEAHAKAFTVAKCMKLDILKDIHSELQSSLEKGTTFATFQKNLMPTLKAKGWWGKVPAGQVPNDDPNFLPPGAGDVQLGSPWRLKTIFNTNLQTAYMAGRYQGMVDTAAVRPYWQYIAVMDAVTRPAHAAMNGRVFPHDDPIWNTWFPPCGFSCRCRTRSLSARELQRYGLSVSRSETNPPADQKGRPLEPDEGFAYNPGKASRSFLSTLAREKQEALEKDIGKITTKGPDVSIVTPHDQDKAKLDEKIRIWHEEESRLAKALDEIEATNATAWDGIKPNNGAEARQVIQDRAAILHGQKETAEQIGEILFARRKDAWEQAREIESDFAAAVHRKSIGSVSTADELVIQKTEFFRMLAYSPVEKRVTDLISSHETRSREAVFNVIRAEQPIEFLVVFTGKNPGKSQKKTIESGIDTFKSLVGVQASVSASDMFQVRYNPSNQRAFQSGRTMEIGSNAKEEAVAHELGHWLENVSLSYAAEAQAFLARRTAGEKTVSLRSITGNTEYERDERTKPDKFLDPYTGKQYTWRDPKTGLELVLSTETTSMFMTQILRDPLQLIEKDPDMFDTFYRILNMGNGKGKTWRKP